MEGRNPGKSKLVVPTDFTSPPVSRTIQDHLVPPSHFASSVQPVGVHRGVQLSGTPPSTSWTRPGVSLAPSGDPGPANTWLAITQAQQEILELRKENEMLKIFQEGSVRGRSAVDHPSDFRSRCTREQWSRWESEWRLEAEKHKVETERLKGQLEALKETAGRHREDMREKDATLNKQSHDLKTMREELFKAKTELGQIREELTNSYAQKEKISSQFETLKQESGEELAEMRRDKEMIKEEARELVLKAEKVKLQAEQEAKTTTVRLSEQLAEIQKQQEAELKHLNASHHAELGAARKNSGELQDRCEALTSEVLQLNSRVMEITTERDVLKQHLSQMGQAFETQSATLQSLRNYIGQLAPGKGEKEQLNETVEKLNKEKAALQMTTDLLTVRLNSVNEILSLQEQKMVKMSSKDPLVKKGSEGLHVLHLWREKVFKLCVQLRSKDLEMQGQKDKLLAKVRLAEQQLQQEQHHTSVLQHSLDDRMAELDMERAEKESVKQDVTQAHKENTQLKSQIHKAETELKTLAEAVRRFSLAFESKVAEVDAAQTSLNTFNQRLTFAKRRVETIQGLTMRRQALQKVQRDTKQADHTTDMYNASIRNLQTELSLVCEERDKLTLELKRTPELIERALADLKQQHGSTLGRLQQELEQSCSREEAQRSLQQLQVQLDESKVNLENLQSELLGQRERSERALQEKMSEMESCCAEKLRQMEVQVNTARREHTKAVLTLRQFEREAARKQDHMRGTQHLQSENTKREIQNKQMKQKEMDKNLLLATDRGFMSGFTRAHTTDLHNSVAPRQKPTDKSRSADLRIHQPADKRLFSVLEELHSLSVAGVNSSEDSAEEEEGQTHSMGPSS